jgi:uncharacterized protein YndB with AHSA1/START domain
MLSINNTVHIDAPPERVWRAMADVERWPEFAPQFQAIKRRDEGPLALGKSARVTPKGFFGAPWTVVEYTEGRSFTWDANMLPGVHLSAGHIVEPEDGGTSVTLSLKASGPMWLLLAPALARIFRRNVRQEADGMKAYCEANPA